MGESRRALVTGGSGGIGRAICEALVHEGRSVVVADLAMASPEETAQRIGGLGVALDVTDETSVRVALKRCEAELGPIDILVNCAGWDEMKPFVDTDEQFQRKVLEINLAGPMRLVRAVLPGMIGRKWGRVINVASDAGRVGSSLEAIYSGAKGGLIAFTKTIAREVARHGITANAVCPGPTATPLLDRMVEGERAEKIIEAMTRAVPMRRVAEPREVASAVVYFASEEASFVTGQTLSVSGGLTMA